MGHALRRGRAERLHAALHVLGLWRHSRLRGPASARSGSPHDKLVFLPSITSKDVWLLQDGNDLQVDIGQWSGDTFQISDGVRVKDWFTTPSTGNIVDEFTATGDDSTLAASQVAQLVQYMSNFVVSSTGSIALTAQEHQALDTTLAQTWQPNPH